MVDNKKVGEVLCSHVGSPVPSKARIMAGFGVNIESNAKSASLSDWIATSKIPKEVIMIKALTEFEECLNYLDDNNWDQVLNDKFNRFFMQQYPLHNSVLLTLLHSQKSYKLKKGNKKETQVRVDTILPDGNLRVVSEQDGVEILLNPNEYDFDLERSVSISKSNTRRTV